MYGTVRTVVWADGGGDSPSDPIPTPTHSEIELGPLRFRRAGGVGGGSVGEGGGQVVLRARGVLACSGTVVRRSASVAPDALLQTDGLL